MQTPPEGSPEGEAVLEQAVFAACVETLYRAGTLPFLTQLLNGALLLAGVWLSVVPRPPLLPGLVWYGLLSTAALVRALVVRPHQRREVSVDEASSLASAYATGSALSGILWGSAAFAVYPAGALPGEFLLAFVVGGMVAGAATYYGAHPASFFAFAVPSMLPLIVRLLLEPGVVEQVMGAAVSLFFLAMVNVNRKGNRALREANVLRLRNQHLAERVTATQARVEELNRGLEDRVRQRTTELEANTAEIARTGYLARLGSLAAGLAHEINNPLAYVTSNLSFLERTLANAPELGEEVRRELAEVIAEAQEGAERVRSTVGHLKAMAQQDDAEPGPVDLHAVLESCLAVSRSELRKHAQVKRELGTVPPVQGKRGELSQVFLALIFKATEMLPPESLAQNRIEIRTEWRGGQEDVVVRFSDNGPGLPEEQLDQLFEPLTGAGDDDAGGLGLAMCHRIVTELGGRLGVDSRPGTGTTFSVYLRPSPEP